MWASWPTTPSTVVHFHDPEGRKKHAPVRVRRHHGPERSDSRGENLLALLAQLALWPDVPVERHGGPEFTAERGHRGVAVPPHLGFRQRERLAAVASEWPAATPSACSASRCSSRDWENLLALLAQLALWPDVPVERHGGDPEFTAERGHRGVAVRHRGLGQPHLGFRQRERLAAVASEWPAATPSACSASRCSSVRLRDAGVVDQHVS